MKIKSVMTACPYTISADEEVDKALEMMKLYNIRHLPIVQGEDLVGVVSSRDLDLSKMLCKSLGCSPKLGDLCSSDPIVISETEDLAVLTKEMAEKKRDYALIVDDQAQFTGIFTTTDACRVLYMLLEEADS